MAIPQAMPLPKRILVIGGGPSGLVTLRNLIEYGKFERVELYERRDDVGGVWYYDDAAVPNPVPTFAKGSALAPPRWPSPAYEGLVGNVLPEYLSFTGVPFPEPPSTPLQPFPTLTETHDYLRNFAAPYLKTGAIKVNREVVRVSESEDGGWRVLSKNWTVGESHYGEEVEEIWDAVVVAVGWYDNPVWPNTPGLDELKSLGLAKHAKWWRNAKGHENKKVLVIGNANSGNDIASQLTKVARLPVYQSIRRPAFFNYPSLEDKRIDKVAPVAQYIVKSNNSSVDASLNKFDALLTDGTLLTDLDSVQVATGYRPFPNFVHVFEHSDNANGNRKTLVPLVTEDTIPNRIPSLHRLVMYAHNPSLAFIGATLAYTPFMIADIASTWLALAWLGEATYPDTARGRLRFEEERLATIQKRREAISCPSSLMVYNILGQDEQEYAASLRRDIVAARPDLDKCLPIWNDERTAIREVMYKTKYEALRYTRSLVSGQ